MVRKSYCGLSDEAQHRIRQIRMAYPDLMSLKGKARERVTHAALVSIARDGAPISRNPYDKNGRRILIHVR